MLSGHTYPLPSLGHVMPITVPMVASHGHRHRLVSDMAM